MDYRPVRTPHYGGHIERLIGTMMGKVHLLPGTTFSDIRAKGDWKPEDTAAMTLDEIERWLAHAIVGVYHHDLHRGIGTTPLAAWERGILGDGRARAGGADGSGRSSPLPDRLSADGAPACPPRRRVPAFDRLLGRRAAAPGSASESAMIVRYDPRDLSRIYLLAPDGRYYDLSYRDLRRPQISLWEHRLALKRLREEGRAQVDENAIFTAIDAMRGIAERASAATKTARRQRERRLRLEPSHGTTPAGRHNGYRLRPIGTAARQISGCSRTWRNGHEQSLLPASAAAVAIGGRCASQRFASGASAQIGGSATHGRKPPWRRWRTC